MNTLALHVARSYAGGILWQYSRDDAVQCARIASWLYNDRRVATFTRALMDQSMRALGWVRARYPDGSRRWIRQERWMMEIETGERKSYRLSRGSCKAHRKGAHNVRTTEVQNHC